MKVIWTGPATRDLRKIGRWIAQHNPTAALEMVRRIRKSVSRLARFPHSGRPGHRRDTRELVVPRTPYIVPYRVHPDRIDVLAVFHGAQDWPDRLDMDS